MWTAELARLAAGTGLAVAKGVMVADAELAAVPLSRHDFHGEWNYTIDSPQKTQT